MNEADRHAILARYSKHSTVVENCYYDDDERCWKQIPELAAEQTTNNRHAARHDEEHTEGRTVPHPKRINPHD